MKSLSVILWSVGLVLQLTLLTMLFVRRAARRVPIFTLLIAFYIARSVALFFLPGVISHATYASLYENLGLVDTVLQIGVAIEIAVTALRQYDRWSRERIVKISLLMMTGVVAALFVAVLLPSRGRAPIDRGTVFPALLMVLLFVWMATARLGGPSRRIVEGFAAYGAVAIAANVVRNQAALDRSGSWYLAGSYAQSGTYLLVVLFWILTVGREPSPADLRQKAKQRRRQERLSATVRGGASSKR
ncbi:MAG: hypothetical protein WA294_16110 [Acidobacteriaceae bacterium]